MEILNHEMDVVLLVPMKSDHLDEAAVADDEGEDEEVTTTMTMMMIQKSTTAPLQSRSSKEQ